MNESNFHDLQLGGPGPLCAKLQLAGWHEQEYSPDDREHCRERISGCFGQFAENLKLFETRII